MTTADRVKTRGRSLYELGTTIPPARRHPSPHPERKRVANLTAQPRVIESHRQPTITATVTEDCDVCQALAKQWDDMLDRDVLMEINNHPHEVPKLSRVKKWKAEGLSVGASAA